MKFGKIGKTKKFTCRYLKEGGYEDSKSPQKKIEATSAKNAAHIFSEQYPSDNPQIWISQGPTETQVVDNPLKENQRKELERVQVMQQRLEPLHEHLKTVEDGNLGDLPYDDLSALIENMWDFPEIRDELNPEERAVREELYKIAFFDRDLQAGLQTSLLNQIASGQPTAGVASSGQSNLTRNAAMLAGGAVALQKLTQIEENTGDVSEGLGFD